MPETVSPGFLFSLARFTEYVTSRRAGHHCLQDQDVFIDFISLMLGFCENKEGLFRIMIIPGHRKSDPQGQTDLQKVSEHDAGGQDTMISKDDSFCFLSKLITKPRCL